MAWIPMAVSAAAALYSAYEQNKHKPSDAAAGYLDQIPNDLKQYLGPYVANGLSQYQGLNQNYHDLMSNPGDVYNRLGSGFQQSPGFAFALKQALQAGGNASAASGLAGSPMATQNQMKTANDLANQDWYNYISNVGNLYGRGLQGSQGIYDQGVYAGGALAGGMAGARSSQAANASAGSMFGNNQLNSMLGAGASGINAYLQRPGGISGGGGNGGITSDSGQ